MLAQCLGIFYRPSESQHSYIVQTDTNKLMITPLCDAKEALKDCVTPWVNLTPVDVAVHGKYH